MSRNLDRVHFGEKYWGETLPHTMDELVEGWVAYFDREDIPHDWNNDGLAWASAAAMDLTFDYPEIAWDFVMAVLAKAPAQRVLNALSGLTLQVLLAQHGNLIIARAEHEASQNSEFRKLLSDVSRHGMHAELWDRVKMAARS